MFWTFKGKTIVNPTLNVRKYFYSILLSFMKKFSPYGGMSNHNAASRVWIPSIFDRPVKDISEKLIQTASGYLNILYSMQSCFDNMNIRDIYFET